MSIMTRECLMILFVISISTPLLESSTTQKGLVVNAIANLYSKPNAQISKFVGPALSRDLGGVQETQLLLNDRLTIDMEKSFQEWLYVEAIDQVKGYEKNGTTLWCGYKGFVARKDVVFVSEFQDMFLTVSSPSAILFQDKQCSKSIMEVSLGTNFYGTFLEDYKVWQVVYPEGIGYMPADALLNRKKNKASDEARKKICTLAHTAIGLPYIWGGRSWCSANNIYKKCLIGFDCSSFIELLYKSCGIIIPRDSGDQKKWAIKELDGDALKPGDVGFLLKKHNNRVHHVFLYLGNQQFIECTGLGFSSVLEVPDQSQLATCIFNDYQAFDKSLASIKNGDSIRAGKYAGNRVCFASFFVD